MKRKLLFPVVFLFLCCGVSSCEGEFCKICSQVTVDESTGDRTLIVSEAEYCGADLLSIEAKLPIKEDNTTTQWVCR
ncbi:MAG TPA: hypothetical protein PLR52_07780 [Bacteroidales bacterium]|nr:hypothetical protein [Bacteroidales bacterium]